MVEAYVVTQTADGLVTGQVTNLASVPLAADEVRIKTSYSGVNYKDYLATLPKTGVIREYPMVPGIDVAGVVSESAAETFPVGTPVLVTGYDLGTRHPGGWASEVTVPANWVVPLPAGLSAQAAMRIGTAGFTAAQAVLTLQGSGMTVDNQPRIAVSGATGGVGMVALHILAKLGFANVTAIVHDPQKASLALAAGASTVVLADALLDTPAKPLLSQTFDFVIDTVGGDLAARLVAMVQANGAMALLGNAGGNNLNISVLPLILRGVTLFGIDSVMADAALREVIWHHFATDWQLADDFDSETVPFDALANVLEAFETHSHHGRTVLAFN